MNIQQIEQEFGRIVEHAFNGRSGGDWDGLKEWNLIKDRFDQVDTEVEMGWSSWILGPEVKAFREHLLVHLPEYNQDGSMNEANHFVIQCARISTKNEFSVRRLMQIAYNIGQMKAMSYDGECLAEFAKLGLWEFCTYVQN